ncbi:MAG: hypothetical protein Q4D06_03565 [Coriobacteriia bacterium]|nr:hypothetical protein [Coriobacteriia bacterium]
MFGKRVLCAVLALGLMSCVNVTAAFAADDAQPQAPSPTKAREGQSIYDLGNGVYSTVPDLSIDLYALGENPSYGLSDLDFELYRLTEDGEGFEPLPASAYTFKGWWEDPDQFIGWGASLVTSMCTKVSSDPTAGPVTKGTYAVIFESEEYGDFGLALTVTDSRIDLSQCQGQDTARRHILEDGQELKPEDVKVELFETAADYGNDIPMDECCYEFDHWEEYIPELDEFWALDEGQNPAWDGRFHMVFRGKENATGTLGVNVYVYSNKNLKAYDYAALDVFDNKGNPVTLEDVSVNIGLRTSGENKLLSNMLDQSAYKFVGWYTSAGNPQLISEDPQKGPSEPGDYLARFEGVSPYYDTLDAAFGIKEAPAQLPDRCSAGVHSYKYVAFVGGECPVNKSVMRRCSDCGNQVESDSSHNWTVRVVAATCTQQGYEFHECACGVTSKDNFTDAVGHDWRTVRANPTCTRAGYTYKKCLECETTTRKVPVAAKGHVWKWTVSKTATASRTGVLKGTCSTCKKTTKKTIASAKVASVTMKAGKKAVVKWNSVAGATSYRVMYKRAGAAKYTTVKVTGTAKTLSKLTAGKKYVVKVKAYRGTTRISSGKAFTTKAARR